MTGRAAGAPHAVAGIRPFGALGWLVEFDTLEQAIAAHARFRAAPLPGQAEAVAGARSVLLISETPADALRTRAALERRPHRGRHSREAPGGPGDAAGREADVSPAPDAPDGADADGADADGADAREPAPDAPRLIELDVVYDGDDLAAVAELAGLSTDAVVAAHTGTRWSAAFAGFAPGFVYCSGGDPRLDVPRLGEPRTRVPAGAVGLADGFCGVYPRASPGGWRLIGRTDAVLWDPGRARPALIRPGDGVAFRAVRDTLVGGADDTTRHAPADGSATAPAPRRPGARAAEGAPLHASAPTSAPPASAPPASALVIEAPGLQCLVQDLGRPGLADLGVSPSGAADARSARQANLLVGNPPAAALIECLLGGVAVTARGEQVLALSGARAAARAGGRPVPADAPFALRDGETLTVDAPTAGLRCYLAVRGGIAVPPVLGSRATDTLAALGPAPCAAGTVLPVGARRGVVGDPLPPMLPPALLDPDAVLELGCTLGPHDDLFPAAALIALLHREWTVTPRSDRVGVRLAPADGGAGLATPPGGGRLPSAGMLAGAVQVPPAGLPVIFLADHPVTGGYPVVAIVDAAGVAAAAQAAPGRRIRFAARPAGPAAPDARASARLRS